MELIMKHLKPKQHYIDLYNRHTVDICRRAEKPSGENDSELLKDKKIYLDKLPTT